MRKLSVLSVLLLICGFAAAQNTVIGGTAGNWYPQYGVYAAPFVPLLTTPSVTLSTVSPSAVGASNATWGNVAGATNATLSNEFVGPAPVGVFTKPVWYGPKPAFEHAARMHEYIHPREERGAEEGFVQGVSGGNWSVAQVARPASGAKASRTYTNQDVERMNQTNGTVKYDGKVEHI